MEGREDTTAVDDDQHDDDRTHNDHDSDRQDDRNNRGGDVPKHVDRKDSSRNDRDGRHGSSRTSRRPVIIVAVVIVAVVAFIAALAMRNHMRQDSRRVDAARTACMRSAASLTKARSSLSGRLAKAGEDGLGKLTADDVADPSVVSDFQKQSSSSKAAVEKAKKPASCEVPSGSSEVRISALAAARKKNQTMADSLEQQEERLKAAIEALSKSRDAKKKSGAGSSGQAESGAAGSGSDSSTAGSGSDSGGSGSNSFDGLGPGSAVRQDKNSPYKPNLDTIPERPR